MRSAWKPVFAAMFAAAVLSACQTSQRSERVPIKLEHSEVSFIGDDSFVVNRLTYRPTKRGEIWRADIMFAGGYLRYTELEPGYYYPVTHIEKSDQYIVAGWNRGRPGARLGITIFLGDVKSAKNTYGVYFYAVDGDAKGACPFSLQYLGEPDNHIDPAAGNKVTWVNFCWDAPRGSIAEVENFLHRVMTSTRFDEGKINKAKAARRQKSRLPGVSRGAVSNAADSTLEAGLQKIRDLEQKGLIETAEAELLRTEFQSKSGIPGTPGRTKKILTEFTWEGVGKSLWGVLDAELAGKEGRMRFRVNGEYCIGNWVLSRGSYSGRIKPEGTWTMKCPGGRLGGGMFISTEPGKGSGSGKDNKGRNIVFYYGL